jgi:DNA polymerase III delta prime subunit
VKQICSAEGENLGDSQLQHLMKVCKGDLRRAVLFAQTWTLTGGFPKVPANEILPFPLNLSVVWSGMKHIPLPYIL